MNRSLSRWMPVVAVVGILVVLWLTATWSAPDITRLPSPVLSPKPTPTPTPTVTGVPRLRTQEPVVSGQGADLPAWVEQAAVRLLRDAGHTLPHPLPKFGHGVLVPIQGGPTLILSYHPSQQNTFTGRLTPGMLDEVLARAKQLAGGV